MSLYFYFFYRCRHSALGKCVHCVPLEVRGIILVFFYLTWQEFSSIQFYLVKPWNHASFIFISLLTKTTWITSTHQWSTCHSTHTFASWLVELISKTYFFVCFFFYSMEKEHSSPVQTLFCSPAEGSLQLWRTSAVRSSRAARATLPGRRASAPSVSPVPSHSIDR